MLLQPPAGQLPHSHLEIAAERYDLVVVRDLQLLVLQHVGHQFQGAAEEELFGEVGKHVVDADSFDGVELVRVRKEEGLIESIFVQPLRLEKPDPPVEKTGLVK